MRTLIQLASSFSGSIQIDTIILANVKRASETVKPHRTHVICIYEFMTHDKIVWLGAFGLMVFAHIRYGRVLLHSHLTNSTFSTNFPVISFELFAFFLFCCSSCAWKNRHFLRSLNLMVIVRANTIYAYYKRMHGNGKRPERKKIGAQKQASRDIF